jgi:AcrR family transcriptional regulator
LFTEEPMGRRGQQREETRQRLLEVARARFAARGFEATQLRDIAREAGVALGTIFVHFTDKRDLLAAALFDSLADAVSRAARVREQGEDFEAWLDEVTATYLEAYTSQPALARVLLREALLADPPWRERFAGLIEDIAATVVRRVEAEKAAGRLSASAEARTFAGAWVSFFTFALVAWVQRTHAHPRRLVATLVHQHLRGMSP